MTKIKSKTKPMSKPKVEVKEKIKFIPKKDESIQELKKEIGTQDVKEGSPEISAEAEELANIEKGLDKGMIKSKPSEHSTIALRDKVEAGKISKAEAKSKAKIGAGEGLAPPQTPEKDLIEESVKRKKEEEDKKKGKIKKVTMADGHTYRSNGKDAECVLCKLKKNNTTTMCFGQPLFPVTLAKFLNKGIDYVDNSWKPKEHK